MVKVNMNQQTDIYKRIWRIMTLGSHRCDPGSIPVKGYGGQTLGHVDFLRALRLPPTRELIIPYVLTKNLYISLVF